MNRLKQRTDNVEVLRISRSKQWTSQRLLEKSAKGPLMDRLTFLSSHLSQKVGTRLLQETNRIEPVKVRERLCTKWNTLLPMSLSKPRET